MPAAPKLKPPSNGSHSQSISSKPPIETIRREEISKLAYQFWLQRGCPTGSAEEDWYHAERELTRPRRPGSAPP